MGVESSVVQVGSWSRSEKSKDGKKKNKKYKDGGDGDDNIQPTGCWFKFKFMDSCIPSRSEVGSSTSTTSIHFEAKSMNDSSRDHQPVAPIISGSTTASNTETSSSASKFSEDLKLSSHSMLRKFTFNELKSATRNFKPESLLGEGGFGCVFKGWIEENGTGSVKPGTGLAVAVKTLNHDGLQGHKEWLAEVNYLGDLIHPNLVNLIGYCSEDDQRLLVYEFMPRGSLENHLFRRSLPLPWSLRMKIVLGAAKGLACLHEEVERPIIYRDFKTSNILLDSDYNAKLSDFGLAKDGPQGDKTHVSTRVMGTYGYAAPEYVMTGHLTSKNDVYSFGVVLQVLFEEGTPRILYKTIAYEKSEESEESSEVVVADPEPEPEARKKGRTPLQLAMTTIINASPRARTKKKKKSTPEWSFATRKIKHNENFLFDLMREKGTKYGSAPQSPLALLKNALFALLTLWIPLAPILWLLHRQLSPSNTAARKNRPKNQLVSFDDVEGVDAAKEELLEIVSCLQGSINFRKLGARLPKGVLLVGPPGTGKTLLARAVAGEADVPFFPVSASEFVELFVGRGASRIRDLFKVARKHSPSIVFIDELDAVGGKRGRSFNDERDQTLNQLLTEMDGFESDTNVIVIGATNRPEALDPALCRPGRFSRRVFVDEPDLDGRRRILGVHIRGVPLEEDAEIICSLIASLTPGFVGADLANIINEAALLAARRGAEVVVREDIMLAIERAKFGIKEGRLTSETISKGLGRLFPQMPALFKRDGRADGYNGYQTLS